MSEDTVLPFTPERPLVVFKYPLLLTAVQSIDMPKDADLLTVQIQDDVPVLWARHRKGGDTEWRRIEMAYTGDHETTSTGPWIGTVQMGPTVYHYFDGGVDDLSDAEVQPAV